MISLLMEEQTENVAFVDLNSLSYMMSQLYGSC